MDQRNQIVGNRGASSSGLEIFSSLVPSLTKFWREGSARQQWPSALEVRLVSLTSPGLRIVFLILCPSWECELHFQLHFELHFEFVIISDAHGSRVIGHTYASPSLRVVLCAFPHTPPWWRSGSANSPRTNDAPGMIVGVTRRCKPHDGLFVATSIQYRNASRHTRPNNRQINSCLIN